MYALICFLLNYMCLCAQVGPVLWQHSMLIMLAHIISIVQSAAQLVLTSTQMLIPAFQFRDSFGYSFASPTHTTLPTALLAPWPETYHFKQDSCLAVVALQSYCLVVNLATASTVFFTVMDSLTLLHCDGQESKFGNYIKAYMNLMTPSHSHIVTPVKAKLATAPKASF